MKPIPVRVAGETTAEQLDRWIAAKRDSARDALNVVLYRLERLITALEEERKWPNESWSRRSR